MIQYISLGYSIGKDSRRKITALSASLEVIFN